MKIISGGQTGADRAALDLARELGLAYGGVIPFARKTEAGPLPIYYEMEVSSSPQYRDRTIANILAADLTILFVRGALKGGSKLTADQARKRGKPLLQINFRRQSIEAAAQLIYSYLYYKTPEVINVAGSRASIDPEIYGLCYETLRRVFLQQGVQPPLF